MGRRKVPLYMRPPDAEEKRGLGLAATPPKREGEEDSIKTAKVPPTEGSGQKRRKNNGSSFVTVIPSASATLRFSEVHS